MQGCFFGKIREGAMVLAALGCLLAGTAQSQTTPTVTLPRPDADGWIKIFRGDNQSDFSIYTGNGSPAQEANKGFGDPFFVEKGDTIRTDGGPPGQLIFKQSFSHYVMSVQLRWPTMNSQGYVLGNCGVMTKIQWNDQGQGGGLPTCIECQGDPGQGMGQIWSLGSNGARPWITFKGATDSHGAKVDSTKPVMDFGGAGGANCIVGYPGWQQPRPSALTTGGWVTISAENHGKDTSRHFVDGIKVMEYWNPRIAKTTNANDVVKTLTGGMVSIQSEGTTVWYRNWKIKLLPEDPLYASLYGTTSILNAAPPVRKGPERYRLGFKGTTLSILSNGRPVSTLTGKRVGRMAPQEMIKP